MSDNDIYTCWQAQRVRYGHTGVSHSTATTCTANRCFSPWSTVRETRPGLAKGIQPVGDSTHSCQNGCARETAVGMSNDDVGTYRQTKGIILLRDGHING